MTDATPGDTPARRRVDRILAPGYLDGLGTRSLDEIRALRVTAEQEETDQSFLRRVLHGRIDILKAELERRATGTDEDIVSALPRILADPLQRTPRGLGRHIVAQPSEPPERRRSAEALVSDVSLNDLGARTDEELQAALVALQAEEQRQSERRQAVQRVVDTCSAEITRRYRTGEASVSDLLNR